MHPIWGDFRASHSRLKPHPPGCCWKEAVGTSLGGAGHLGEAFEIIEHLWVPKPCSKALFEQSVACEFTPDQGHSVLGRR